LRLSLSGLELNPDPSSLASEMLGLEICTIVPSFTVYIYRNLSPCPLF
jgi:hypothetical protein